MNGRPFFDTNVLVYALSEADSRAETARRLLAEGGVVSVQILNEFVAVGRRKLRLPWRDIRQALRNIRILLEAPVPITLQTHASALEIATRHGYGIYDSLVIAAALEASCRVLYSEDMQDGQIIRGLTVRNPFVLR